MNEKRADFSVWSIAFTQIKENKFVAFFLVTPLLLGIVISLLFFAVFAFIFLFLLLLLFVILLVKAQKKFWQKIGEFYGWSYSSNKNILTERALLFRVGHTRVSPHCLSGDYAGHSVNIFDYQYTVGSGKNKHTSFFRVFEIKFSGIFPHIYLNYKKDWSSHLTFFNSFTKLPIPTVFEKKFDLYSPNEYEIEALEIFTPEVFAFFLEKNWDFDVEFLDSEMIIYSRKRPVKFSKFDAELGKVKECVDFFSQRLNKAKFSQIGNKPYNF